MTTYDQTSRLGSEEFVYFMQTCQFRGKIFKDKCRGSQSLTVGEGTACNAAKYISAGFN